MRQDATGRTVTAHEPRETPWLSVVLGYGPMLPILAGAAAAWALPGEAGRLAGTLAILWANAILLFLSGVRRGVSFRTEGGPTAMQIGTMMLLFSLGFAALAALQFGRETGAIALLVLGFGAVAVLDPIAAARGEAPLFFARLRPLQIPIGLAGLLGLLTLKLSGGS
ncbi:DUF3429 domain-containing protein [Methylobacterium durans]|uniref:DUF3429 domain-containing protein n=1 Tax=Methylobacterium durans TaxID=2202825 RepID=A0A2U8W4F5_9HYPH|nr:DUF3429 domain-containing protein [Methylobacterium durans]AWN40993.1 DUF3429 domain-containing protein [Methylobacterium durans]